MMRNFSLKILGILFVALFAQVPCHAEEWNGQSLEEQQRIKEMRLLEWHAQQQSKQFPNQDQVQNVSFNRPTPSEVTPDRQDLFDAANSGNIQQISKLLSRGLDINVSNNQRETALHMAAARGHFEAVQFLVRRGAYINAQTVKNWIPLHHAVRFRHPNVVNFLIQRGSSAQARTSDGLSSIDMANNNRDYRLLSIMGAR